MSVGKTLGFALFVGGLGLLFFYGLYLGFEDLLETLDVISSIFLVLVIAGFAILLVSIIMEQRRGSEENLKGIKKEDLKP